MDSAFLAARIVLERAAWLSADLKISTAGALHVNSNDASMHLLPHTAKDDGDFADTFGDRRRRRRANIVEGFARFWPSEFAHKLWIAIGELEETQDHPRTKNPEPGTPNPTRDL